MEKIGRNDLCPCGSGKKYKKCCGKNNVISMDHLIDEELKELQLDIINFANSHYEDEIADYLAEWYEEYQIPEEAFEMFHFFSLIWFITSYSLKGKTILSHYIDKHSSKLVRPRVRDLLQTWKNGKPSVAVVMNQEGNQLITLQDIFTEEIYKVKELDGDHPVEAGGIILGIILPAGVTPVFFTTFIDLPASLTEKVKDRVHTMYDESVETNPSDYLAKNYPEVLHLFVFGMEPTIEELDWISPKHLEVAIEFKKYMEIIHDEVIINLGVHLWYQYCSRKNPRIIKTSVYAAALVYLVDQLNPFGEVLTQNELAEEFDISKGSLSAKYRDMEDVLHEEIAELEEKLSMIDFEDDDFFFDDDEDLFEDDEDDNELFFDDDKLFTDKMDTINPNTRITMERELLKLETEMEDHPFESLDEVNNFLNKRLNKPNVRKKELTNKEKAQELLFDAYEATGKKKMKLAKEALKLYPDSPDAYNILAGFTISSVKEEELLLKAIEAGERELGQDFFKENKGHFWGIVSTRPYMRAKFNYARLLQDVGRLEKAVQQYEELLELNPNDNQGVRYELFRVFVELDMLKHAERLLDRFNEDTTANGAYNRVLLEFLQNGPTNKAKQLLQKAKKQNPHVPAYLLGKKMIPMYLPACYQLGDESEAILYADNHLDLWQNNHPLMEWFKKTK